MADDVTREPELREWRAYSSTWGREIRVEARSRLEFAVKLGDTVRLSSLTIPAGLSADVLATELERAVDDASWCAEIISGGMPVEAPMLTAPMQRLAVLGAADLLFGEQVVPSVLAIEKALALYSLGDREGALLEITLWRSAAVEVVEMMLDVGVADCYRGDLIRLLDVVIETTGPAAQLESLRADLARPKCDTWDYRPDASDYPFTTDLRRTETSALLSEDLAGAELRKLIDAPADLPNAELLDRARSEAWRTSRMQKAVEQLPGRTTDEERQVAGREADPATINHLCRRLGAAAVEGASGETLIGPAPLLCELVQTLLMMRPELRGALELAALDDRRLPR